MTARRLARWTSCSIDAEAATRGTRLLWWAAVIAVAATLVAPLLIVDMPLLGDYPNHLARAFVLASLPDDRVLAQMYAAHWSIIPNLGLDLLLPPLIHVLPVHVAGRLVIALAVLLTFLGAVAYNRNLGGSWWALGAGLAAWNSCLLYGFLNFSLSLGLALMLAAGWLRWREARPVLALGVGVPGALALFACHLMGLLFFALLAACAELAALRRPFLRNVLRRAAVLGLVLLAPAALYASSALQGLGGDASWVSPWNKGLQLLTTFANFNWWLDRAAFVLAVGVPAAALILRRGRFPPPAAWAMGALLIAYLAAPFSWKGTFLLDTRLSTMLDVMLFAGFVPRGWTKRATAVTACAAASLFLLRMSVLATAFSNHRAVLTELRTAIAPIPAGATVAVADAGFQEAPDYWAADPHWLKLSNGVPLSAHLGALVLIERRAYWPFEFDIPSQQPIVTLQPFADLATRTDTLPDRTRLLRMDLCGFSHVLLTDAEAVPPLPEARFRLLRQEGFGALYEIRACRPETR